MRVPLRSLCVVALCLAATASAGTSAVTVATYPSSQTIAAAGPPPRQGGRTLVYNVAIGEREGAFLVVSRARNMSVSVSPTRPAGITARLLYARFVRVSGRLVPDVLEPWDGTARGTGAPNQPVLVQIDVPYGSRPGKYRADVTVTADGRSTRVPLHVTVFPVTLPHPGTRVGNLLTSFHVSPESYVGKAADLYGFRTNEQRIAANRSLFGFLGSYRISPGSWGFGEPRTPAGYESSARWWLDAAGNFVGQLAASPGFSALRIPISSNRTSKGSYIAGMSPFAPESWCDYLGRVRSFWAQHRALRSEAVPYLFGFDEPGPSGQRLVARQAAVLHRCFAGGRVLMTGTPSKANSFLWDGKRGNDVDIWTVLSRRFYGIYTSPREHHGGGSRSRRNLAAIKDVRARAKLVWSYTYTGPRGTPGFAATEPLSNPRMFMLWNALEDVQGVLYGQGTTSYKPANPFESIGTGEKVLVYPGPFGPLASARLEQIRDGIEDWAIFHMVRARRGADDVRAILGKTGLFSATRAGVRLACNLNCELRSRTKFAWPIWSRDASTPRRIEAAKLAALRLAR